MKKEVTRIILEALKEQYGEEFVEESDGNIYVTDGDTGACEISIQYEE